MHKKIEIKVKLEDYGKDYILGYDYNVGKDFFGTNIQFGSWYLKPKKEGVEVSYKTEGCVLDIDEIEYIIEEFYNSKLIYNKSKAKDLVKYLKNYYNKEVDKYNKANKNGKKYYSSGNYTKLQSRTRAIS